jgi:hypothetical protein
MEELENPSVWEGHPCPWNRREGKDIRTFVVKKVPIVVKKPIEGMDVVQEDTMNVVQTSAVSTKREGAVLPRPAKKPRAHLETRGRNLSKQIPIVPRGNLDQDSQEVVDLSGGGGGGVYESIRQYASRYGSEDPACQIMHAVPSPERSSKKAETGHEEVALSEEEEEKIAHDKARALVQVILRGMQSQRRTKKTAHTFGEGIPQVMHEAWPRDPSAGRWSVEHCAKKCPNFLYASLVIEILVGFEFDGGNEPSMEDLHGMFMLVCSNAKFGRNRARLRRTIVMVLVLAQAVNYQESEIDGLTDAYHGRDRCVPSENKHWYFLVRMRPELSRFLAKRAIRAMIASGWITTTSNLQKELRSRGEQTHYAFNHALRLILFRTSACLRSRLAIACGIRS